MSGHAVELSGGAYGTSCDEKGDCEMDVKKINELFNQELKVINMGLDSFAENLRKEEVEVLQMEWKPPAGGNKKLISLLEKLGR
jgi:FdrA protein